jgi:hypothetical protein
MVFVQVGRRRPRQSPPTPGKLNADLTAIFQTEAPVSDDLDDGDTKGDLGRHVVRLHGVFDMSDPTITHEFVRALTEGIRNAFGKDVPHTAVMDLIAEASGRKTDAMMHKLKMQVRGKNYRLTADTKEAPDAVPAETISRWVEKRKWRNVAKTAAFLLSKKGAEDLAEDVEDSEIDWTVVAACGALSLIYLSDTDEALAMMQDQPTVDPRVLLVATYAKLSAGQDDAAVKDMALPCILANPSVLVTDLESTGRIKSIFGDLHGGPFADLAADIAKSDGSSDFGERTKDELIQMLVPDEHEFVYHDWSGTLDSLLASFGKTKLNIAIIRIAMETGADIELKPAVAIDQSVGPESIACLFIGQWVDDMSDLIADYGLTPDQYRMMWKLPKEYPISRAQK